MLFQKKHVNTESFSTLWNVVILNRSAYISKIIKILKDTSKIKIVNFVEGKTLNHLIHIDERFIHRLKRLEDPGKTFEEYYHFALYYQQ